LIKEVGEDIDNFKFNTAIAKFMKFLNKANKRKISKKDLARVLRSLAPFAPYLTEEIWRNHFKKSSIHKESWPRYSKRLVKEKAIILILQINGKVRDRIEVESGISEKGAKKLALSSEKIQKWIKGKEIKRIVFVPEKLINIVV